jgi:hypothetical protein
MEKHAPICGINFAMLTLAGWRSSKRPLDCPLSRSVAVLGEGQKSESAGRKA